MVRCLVCHRKLVDKESISRKIGPACLKKLLGFAKECKVKRTVLKPKSEEIEGQINLFD